MAFLSAEELTTHLYAENINVISNNDPAILEAAIDGAKSEARGYLGRFDTEVIFSAEAEARNALLLIFVKDIAVWHFVNLCNAGTDLALRQHRYDRAVDWLKAVQKGNVTPDLPIKTDDEGEAVAGLIIFGSNPQKNQHF